MPGALEVRHVGDGDACSALPGQRFVAAGARGRRRRSSRARFANVATPAGFDVWRWLTIRAGVPVITAATQDAFVAQAANWDVLGGIDFQKGCYTGQEIIARTQYLGRLKERTYLFHADTRRSVGRGQDLQLGVRRAALRHRRQRGAAPGGGSDLLAVLQIAAAERGDARLHAPDGPRLAALPLPYAIPAPSAPRGRSA